MSGLIIRKFQRRHIHHFALGLFGACALVLIHGDLAVAEGRQVILEDFSSADTDGFPVDWEHENQRSQSKGREAYRVRSEGGLKFLEVKDAGQRIKKKKIDWDPKTYPILTWRWRLHKVPSGDEMVAAIYASLDTDLLFIPVFTKYVWSATKPEGTLVEGGMFSGSEVVVQSGALPLNEWVEERVNVYEDFKRIHKHEPAAKAWGISIWAGPGVEIDVASVAVSSP